MDTEAWFASMVPGDANHVAAANRLANNTMPLLTTDYIFAETITLLTAKRQRHQAVAFGSALIATGLATLHFIGADEVLAAWHVSLRWTR